MLDSTSPATNSNCVCPYPCVRGLIGFLFRDSSRAASNADIEACGCTIVDTSFVSSLRVGGADVERELANESNWANGSSPAAADPGYPRIKVLVDEIPTNERPRSTKSRREEGASTYCDDGEIVEYVVGCGGRAIRASRMPKLSRKAEKGITWMCYYEPWSAEINRVSKYTRGLVVSAYDHQTLLMINVCIPDMYVDNIDSAVAASAELCLR